MLNPLYPAAVVAGNVKTSQAIADALSSALGVLRRTMNNFTFGAIATNITKLSAAVLVHERVRSCFKAL